MNMVPLCTRSWKRTTQPGILTAGRTRALRRLRDMVCETAAAAATKIGEGVAIATNRPMVAHSM